MLGLIIVATKLMVFILTSTVYSCYLDKVDVTRCRPDIHLDDTIPVTNYFDHVDTPLEQECIVTDPLLLQQVVKDALSFLKRYWKTHTSVIAPGKFSDSFMSQRMVAETLQHIDAIIEEDKKNNQPFRILDPNFLQQEFGFIQWYGNRATNRAVISNNPARKIDEGKIKLTHYVMFQLPGSYHKTKKFCYPLYRLREQTKRLPYTKKQILNGMLERGSLAKEVEPMVWVTREGLEEAMLQGTIFLVMPDKKIRAFNVDFSNGFTFDHTKKLFDQDIYWFFREAKSEDLVKKMIKRSHNRRGVLFAGDLYHIGFGKVIAFSYKNRQTKKQEMRIGVLGDTGGGFKKNLYQVDFFAGIFSNKRVLQQYLSYFPDTVTAYILYKRKTGLLK